VINGIWRGVPRPLLQLLLAAVVAFGASAMAEPVQTIPSGLIGGLLGDDGLPIPIDGDGLPARRLSDSELHRVLLHLSRTIDEASLRLALCHTAGAPFGSTGWRYCIERR